MSQTFLGESVRARDPATEIGVSISLTFAVNAPALSRVVLLFPYVAIGFPDPHPPFVGSLTDSAGNVFAAIFSGILSAPSHDFAVGVYECVLTAPHVAGVTTLGIGAGVAGCDALVFSTPRGPAHPTYDGTYRELTHAEKVAEASDAIYAGNPTHERVLIGGAILNNGIAEATPLPHITGFSSGWTALTELTYNDGIVPSNPDWFVFRACYRIVPPAGAYQLAATFQNADYLGHGVGDIWAGFWAPIGFGSWTIQCEDPCTGNLCVGIECHVTCESPAFDQTIYSDANGVLTLDGLADGLYLYQIGPNFDTLDHASQVGGTVGTINGNFTILDSDDVDQGLIEIGRPSGCPGTVGGRVTDGCTVLPAWGVRVELVCAALDYDAVAYTDSNGRLPTFNVPGAGTYTYTIGPTFNDPSHVPDGTIGTLTGTIVVASGGTVDLGTLSLSRPAGCPGGVGVGIDCAETAGVGGTSQPPYPAESVLLQGFAWTSVVPRQQWIATQGYALSGSAECSERAGVGTATAGDW